MTKKTTFAVIGLPLVVLVAVLYSTLSIHQASVTPTTVRAGDMVTIHQFVFAPRPATSCTSSFARIAITNSSGQNVIREIFEAEHQFHLADQFASHTMTAVDVANLRNAVLGFYAQTGGFMQDNQENYGQISTWSPTTTTLLEPVTGTVCIKQSTWPKIFASSKTSYFVFPGTPPGKYTIQVGTRAFPIEVIK